MFWFIIICMGVILDQASKWLVLQKIGQDDIITVIPNLFFIINIRNSGAAWGILRDNPYILMVMIIFALLIVGFLLFKKKDKWSRTCLSIIIGGALGNLIDRIFRGGVIDFLDFHFGWYHYPTFNIGDSLIVIGSVMFAIKILMEKEGAQKFE